MNQGVVDLFWNPDKKAMSGLVFEMASQEFPKGNSAVGVLRGRAATDFFSASMDRVKVAERRNGFDATIFGTPLSIKTVTGNVKLFGLLTRSRPTPK